MDAFVCGGPPTSGPKLEARDFLPQFTYCCYGAVDGGARFCTCWTPVWDLEQQEPDLTARVPTRGRPCDDCAYREGSPERKTDAYALLDLPVFWCHKGMRRPRSWRHPDGRVRPGYPADYQPVFHARPDVAERKVPYKANGQPALRCGGWQMERKALDHALSREWWESLDGHESPAEFAARTPTAALTALAEALEARKAAG